MWVIIQAPVVVHSTAVVVVIERTSRSSIIKHMRREEDAAQGRAPCRLIAQADRIRCLLRPGRVANVRCGWWSGDITLKCQNMRDTNMDHNEIIRIQKKVLPD